MEISLKFNHLAVGSFKNSILSLKGQAFNILAVFIKRKGTLCSTMPTTAPILDESMVTGNY